MIEIPRGPLSLSLRSKLLDFFPDEEIRIAFDGERGLHNFFVKGTYVTRALTTKKAYFDASPVDLCKHSLLEIEQLMDHAFEQLIDMLGRDDHNSSPAWTAVGFYYFGFFTIQAFARLLGHPIFFALDETFEAYRLTHPKSWGGGTYSISLTVPGTTTSWQYCVSQTGGRVHDATWKWLLLQLRQQIPANAKKTDEIELFKQLTTTILCRDNVGYEWPSDVRNAVNYRPGLAYRMVANDGTFLPHTLTSRCQYIKETSILNAISSSACECSNGTSIRSRCLLMTDVSLGLFILMRSLYMELYFRRTIDKRWELRRRQLLNRLPLKIANISRPILFAGANKGDV